MGLEASPELDDTSKAETLRVRRRQAATMAPGSNSNGGSGSCIAKLFSLTLTTAAFHKCSAVEVKLCGHATLAAAHFLWSLGLVNGEVIYFSTKSGTLTAKRVVSSNIFNTIDVSSTKAAKFFIELDFPVLPVAECDASETLSIPVTLNGASIINVQKFGADEELMIELSSAKDILNLQPNFEEIQCAGGDIVVTASAPANSEFDFFTRYFCPKFGINEDPVCGSVHCALAPYWSKKLGKNSLVAYMASPRSGRLDLELIVETQRLLIRGEAVTVMTGTLLV